MLSLSHLRLISQLYRHSPSRPLLPFRAWALNRLAQSIPHDASIWTNVTAHSHRAYLTSSLGIVSDDDAVQNAVSSELEHLLSELQPRRPLISGMDTESHRRLFNSVDAIWKNLPFEPEPPQAFIAVLTGSIDSPDTSLILLARMHDTFTSEEAELLTHLGFYLADASALACFLHLRTPALMDRNRRAAIVSPYGDILEAQPYFKETLAEAFPEHSGDAFPIQPTAMRLGKSPAGDSHLVDLEVHEGLYVIRVWKRTALDDLTDREMQCAVGVCRGLSHKEIAKELGISPSTIATHFYRAIKKVGAKDKATLRDVIAERRIERKN